MTTDKQMVVCGDCGKLRPADSHCMCPIGLIRAEAQGTVRREEERMRKEMKEHKRKLNEIIKSSKMGAVLKHLVICADALDKYGEHTDECKKSMRENRDASMYDGPCICGLDEVVGQIDEAIEGVTI